MNLRLKDEFFDEKLIKGQKGKRQSQPRIYANASTQSNHFQDLNFGIIIKFLKRAK